jgi:hypothetical protein
MLPSVVALGVAVAVAWWSWRGRLAQPLARWAMLARIVAIASVLFLLIDPGIASRRLDNRPLVLLDNSISMHASGGRAGEAHTLAASLGDTITFGELMRREPGGRSMLFDPLAGAVASGRPVTIVTDGEIGDATTIPADLLAQAAVRILPRAVAPDIALTDVRAPQRLTAGDSLAVDIDLRRTPGSPDTAEVVVRDSLTALMHGVARFGSGDRAHLHLLGALPHSLQGDRWIEVARVGGADAEADDDVRWLRLSIAATPGIVVIAESPDWDARALYRTLKDVVEAPIRGYVQLQRGQWRRMDDLRNVATADVTAAAKRADLLAVRGDPKAWLGSGRARLIWPAATQTGDWYVAVGNVSPMSGAFAGVDADSFPAAAGVHPLDADATSAWIGATARLSRRGMPIPVIGGNAGRAGRTVTIGVDGLYRWSMRGGLADQVWRTMLANAATWLLAAPEGDSVRARVTESVTQRGRPVHFRWVGAGLPVALGVQLSGPSGERRDTLRFDGAGDAALPLAVGRYRYLLDGGGSGAFAVEPFADELLPSPVTLKEHAGSAARTAPRRSLRELTWLFAVAIVGFGAEWMLRRRLGLR